MTIFGVSFHRVCLNEVLALRLSQFCSRIKPSLLYMIMSSSTSSCDICQKAFTGASPVVVHYEAVRRWHSGITSDRHLLFMSERRMNACVTCGRLLGAWDALPSREHLKRLRDREITGCELVRVLRDPPTEPCAVCRQETGYYPRESIHVRQCYVEGIGQLCGSCYYATMNTGVGDEFLDYLR